MEAYALAALGGNHKLVVARCKLHGNKRIVVVEFNSDFAVFVNSCKLFYLSFLYKSAAGCKGDKPFRTLFNGDYSSNFFVLCNLDEVYNRPAARRTRRFRNFVSLNSIYPAAVAKQQQIVVRGAYEHFFHEVLFLGTVRRNALTAAVLRVVLGNGQTLYVARVGHRNYYLLYGD